jgi:hypothetical protein
MRTVFLFLSLLLMSCGAKTVNKQETKTDSIAKTIAVVRTDSIAKDSTAIKFDVETEEIVIEAVDTTRPIEIVNNDGKITKYKNARLSKKKKKDNTILVNKKTVDKVVVDSVSNEIQVKKVDKAKAVHKEQFSWSKFLLDLWWLWLLLLLALYIAYRYKKGLLKFPML